jgi:teichuronic acid biosynthesis glycosyltransferase TuaG
MTKNDVNECLVSVIMPAYNAEKTINKAIDSVISQTYKNLELIVINDKSTDLTGEILKSYEKKDSRIHVLNNDINSGVSYSRNRGIEYARGKYIAFLDSDDIWQKDKICKQVALMQKKNAVLSYTASAFINSEGKRFHYIMPAQEKTSYKTLLRKNLVSCSSAMVKSSVMKNMKMPNDRMHEDYYIWLTILKNEKFAYGINEPLLIYRVQKNSKSSNRLKSAMMAFNTYNAVGYNKVISFLLTMRYTLHSVSKRMKIRKK